MKKTSRDAHDSIKPAKAYYHAKVIEGLTKLKVGGTFAEIALAAGITPEKVWKRLSELEKDGQIYDTGITRKLPSGRAGTVWQIVGLEYANPENPKTDEQVRDFKKAGINLNIQPYFASQPELFQ